MDLENCSELPSTHITYRRMMSVSAEIETTPRTCYPSPVESSEGFYVDWLVESSEGF